jgi:hypothetical protein
MFHPGCLQAPAVEEEGAEKNTDESVIFDCGFSRFSGNSSGADSALVSSSPRGGIDGFGWWCSLSYAHVIQSGLSERLSTMAAMELVNRRM